jgi:hypothetical protein
MSHGPHYLQQQAALSAALRLKPASTFTRLNIKQPLFQKRMGKGADSVLVRFEWPGVLSVIDPETGDVLAVSESGRPDVLRAGFVPVVPALLGNGSTPNSNRGR